MLGVIGSVHLEPLRQGPIYGPNLLERTPLDWNNGYGECAPGIGPAAFSGPPKLWRRIR
jgi:hypothetical protein